MASYWRRSCGGARLRRARRFRAQRARCYIDAALIDLDHNATTPLDPRVADAMAQWLASTDTRRNPSSVHRLGQAARADIEDARRRVAAAVGADAMDVTFCSGGTEADALAVLGVARALRRRGQPWGLLTSPLEHAAVIESAKRLRDEGGCVAFVDVDARGRIAADHVAAMLGQAPEIGLVSLAAANHELGNLYDVRGFVEAARRQDRPVLVHTDAVQALGKVPVDFSAWDVDALSISAHKVGGPTGVGALIHRRELDIASLWGGGSQERGRRPGTEAALSIHGFGRAADLVADRVAASSAVTALRQRLQYGLRHLNVPGITVDVLGDDERHVGNTLCVRFAGCRGELVMINLDLAGIAVSTGSACSVGRVEPSPVVRALGFDAAAAQSVVRFSLGPENTRDDIDAVLAVLPAVLARVRGVAESEGVAL